VRPGRFYSTRFRSSDRRKQYGFLTTWELKPLSKITAAFSKKRLGRRSVGSIGRRVEKKKSGNRFRRGGSGSQEDGGKISEVLLADDGSIKARNYILATGGKSYPATGSTGDGYDFAYDMGHRIEKLKPALTPLKTAQTWAKKLSGVSLKRPKVTVLQNGKKIFSQTGELIFTHFGLSGPVILGMSLRIGELIESGPVALSINLLPENNLDRLNNDLRAMFVKIPIGRRRIRWPGSFLKISRRRFAKLPMSRPKRPSTILRAKSGGVWPRRYLICVWMWRVCRILRRGW